MDVVLGRLSDALVGSWNPVKCNLRWAQSRRLSCQAQNKELTSKWSELCVLWLMGKISNARFAMIAQMSDQECKEFQ